MKKHQTLQILELGLELLAMARAAISTWLVVSFITGGNLLYTAFSVGVVEGALLISLILLRQSAIAPITAIIAIGFSAVMQYEELRVLDGTITTDERAIMRYSVAFAPIVLLVLAYVKRLVEDVDMAEVVGRVTAAIAPAHYPEREELEEAHAATPLPLPRQSQKSAVLAKNGTNEP